MNEKPPYNRRASDRISKARLFSDADQLVRSGLKQIRRLVILLVGVTIVLIGVLMLFTPGPAIVVIPVGLGVLGLEFAWARLLLQRFRDKAANLRKDMSAKFSLDNRQQDEAETESERKS